MATTSEDREVKDPAEATGYAVEITIPTTLGSMGCGVRLASEGDGYYQSDWWVKGSMSGVGSFAHEGELECGYADNGDEIPFSTRRAAALDAAQRLLDKLREINPDDDSKAQEDVKRFMVAAEIGDVPELDEPEGDSLPTGESPLSDEDELAGLRGRDAEAYTLAMEIETQRAFVQDVKDDLKQANKKLERANQALTQHALNQRNQRRDMPLFNQNEASQPDPALSEPWRTVLLADLLSGAIVTNLADNPGQALTTLGELADFEAEIGIDNPLCAIPKIGASAAEKICAARVEWFRQHPPEGEGPLKAGE